MSRFTHNIYKRTISFQILDISFFSEIPIIHLDGDGFLFTQHLRKRIGVIRRRIPLRVKFSAVHFDDQIRHIPVAVILHGDENTVIGNIAHDRAFIRIFRCRVCIFVEILGILKIHTRFENHIIRELVYSSDLRAGKIRDCIQKSLISSDPVLAWDGKIRIEICADTIDNIHQDIHCITVPAIYIMSLSSFIKIGKIIHRAVTDIFTVAGKCLAISVFQAEFVETAKSIIRNLCSSFDRITHRVFGDPFHLTIIVNEICTSSALIFIVIKRSYIFTTDRKHRSVDTLYFIYALYRHGCSFICVGRIRLIRVFLRDDHIRCLFSADLTRVVFLFALAR